MDASICWVVESLVHCYLTVMKGAKVATLYWKYYNVYAWGVPTLLVASGFIVRRVKGIQVFGPSGGYCQVADNDLRLYIFYVELW
ncbi:hypothetical protein BCR33DRAFT_711128 [Rhizoclosmatium globosum]|uniref:G-protein coupled receptors family 2 profile 2 domain-containing protein n=1 Tax=Rhizoclosmatium globosum TaxID=329046 RepID=A0A1Y2D392_9FUNG|nr:hypothetical protein BCR33DRAFT_711128 [Rhizoclosmatium globosum]|eukprot:ORY53768.1 hypothetical protein BCR33DRAFT_711128 [Rhizoclosmatium globosum]